MVKCPILPYNVRSSVASSLMVFAFPNWQLRLSINCPLLTPRVPSKRSGWFSEEKMDSLRSPYCWDSLLCVSNYIIAVNSSHQAFLSREEIVGFIIVLPKKCCSVGDGLRKYGWWKKRRCWRELSQLRPPRGTKTERPKQVFFTENAADSWCKGGQIMQIQFWFRLLTGPLTVNETTTDTE